MITFAQLEQLVVHGLIDFNVIHVFEHILLVEVFVVESFVWQINESVGRTSFDVENHFVLWLFHVSNIIHNDDIHRRKVLGLQCVHSIDPGQKGVGIFLVVGY